METTKNKKQKTILDCELLGLHLERVEKKFHEMGIPEEDFVTNRLEDELEVMEWFVTIPELRKLFIINRWRNKKKLD